MTQQATRMATTSQVTAKRPAPEKIEALAYSLWQERGCPDGSSEEDWLKAEETLAADSER